MDAWHIVAGLGLALAASACIEVGYAVQAGEARHPDHDHHATASLLTRLVRRRAWRGGTLLVVVGVGLQLVALGVSSVAVVQPTMILGLGLLVVLAERRLGERVRRPERLGVAAAGAGAVLVALGATGDQGGPPGHRALALGALGAVLLAGLVIGRAGGRPRALVVAAAAGDAWAVLGAKLAVDDLAAGRLPAALAWGAAAAAAGLLALTAEMAALRRLPVATVGSLVLAGQAVVPVLLGGAVVGERWTAPVAVLAGLALVAVAATVLARPRSAVLAGGALGRAAERLEDHGRRRGQARRTTGRAGAGAPSASRSAGPRAGREPATAASPWRAKAALLARRWPTPQP